MHRSRRRYFADMGLEVAGISVAMVLLVGLAGCAEHPTSAREESRPTPVATAAATAAERDPSAEADSTEPVGDWATFVSVIDGDTIETSAGTVRILGIDTPERGECGHNEASAAIGRLLSAGDQVTVELPPGENDHDRHGRLIRYVITDAGVDLGLMQLEAGNALARYDSFDGYPRHPRESAYHAAQVASLGPDGSVLTIACQGAAPPPASSTDGHWWERYSSCAKLKRNPDGHPTGPFARDDPDEADLYDWFANRTGNRGDGDGDGLACE